MTTANRRRFWSRVAWSLRSRGRAPRVTVAGLPADDPFAALALISEQVDQWRAAGAAATEESARQLAELELSARRCYRDATRRYLAALHVQAPGARAAWGQTVHGCLVRLAHAHQSLVVPWTRPRSGPRLASEAVPPALARGVRLGAAILKWNHLCGAAEPAGVWADMCRLYAMAEGRACARTPLSLAPGIDPRSSIEREFLKACMLGIARPSALQPAQVDIAERAVEFCTPGFALSSAADPRFGHLVDIEGGEGPRARNAGMAPTPSVRSFGMDGAERLLAALLRLVESDRIPPRDFGVEVEKERVVEALRHLESCWCAAPPQPAAARDTALDQGGARLHTAPA